MGKFLTDAAGILESARLASQMGDLDEIHILLTQEGSIRMIQSGGWTPDSLRLHHGALAAYRVTRAGGRVRLEGSAAGQSCRLECDLGTRASTVASFTPFKNRQRMLPPYAQI